MCRTVAVAASAALIFSALSVPPADAGDLTIYNIEVGLDSSSGSYAQGDSALIQFPNGKTMLIDGGNSNDYGGNTVLAVFNLIGFTGPLDYVVCSHFHTDHMNGLVTVCTADNYRFRPTAANSVFDNGDAAVIAPAGQLTGTLTLDGDRQYATLPDGDGRTVEVEFPQRANDSLLDRVKAIQAAGQSQTLPPLVELKLYLQALDVKDADDVIDAVTDDDGNFVPLDIIDARVRAMLTERGDA